MCPPTKAFPLARRLPTSLGWVSFKPAHMGHFYAGSDKGKESATLKTSVTDFTEVEMADGTVADTCAVASNRASRGHPH